MSLKRFDGWEPVTETVYEYDDAGRLLRAVTCREVEWDDEQQQHMLALGHMRAMVCGGCGGWLPETTATEAELYRVPPPVRCGKCTAIAIGQDRHAKDHNHMHATRWAAEKR